MSPADNPFLALDKEKIYHDFSYDILEQIFNQIMGYAQEEEEQPRLPEHIKTLQE